MSVKQKVDYGNIAIVIPAYRETRNLQTLTREIFRLYPGINVVIVDDSPKNENLKLKAILFKTKRKLKIIKLLLLT